MDILRQIIDLDKAAAARVETSVEKYQQRTDEFGISTARELEKRIDDEKVKMERFRAEQEEALAKKRAESEESCRLRCESLDKSFEQKGAEWKREIIKRVTEG